MARMDAAGEAPAPAPARRPIVPSPQQAAFLTHVEGSDSHVLLEARAGSGKSTTCREAAWRLHARGRRSLYAYFLDEAQDLNPAQHALVPLLAPEASVIVVGDRYQSIYAWRGANPDSIPILERQLELSERGIARFPLTVTRRCPTSHVELARRLVPDLDALPGAIAGEVLELKPEGWFDLAEPGAMVLCRTNAPLVSACYRLIRSGRKALVRGREIGKGLLAMIARMRCREVSDLLRRLSDYRVAEIERLSELRNPAGAIQAVNDKVDCLAALCDGASSIDEVRGRAESMFSDLDDRNAVVLSSVHRAKGLEADTVVILRPDLLPGPWAETPQDVRQERNCLYVAATRSRRLLAFAGGVPAILRD